MLDFTSLTAHIPIIVLYDVVPFWLFLTIGEDGQDLYAREGKFPESGFLNQY